MTDHEWTITAGRDDPPGVAVLCILRRPDPPTLDEAAAVVPLHVEADWPRWIRAQSEHGAKRWWVRRSHVDRWEPPGWVLHWRLVLAMSDGVIVEDPKSGLPHAVTFPGSAPPSCAMQRAVHAATGVWCYVDRVQDVEDSDTAERLLLVPVEDWNPTHHVRVVASRHRQHIVRGTVLEGAIVEVVDGFGFTAYDTACTNRPTYHRHPDGRWTMADGKPINGCHPDGADAIVEIEELHDEGAW